jgi:LmbE family N-acetylglucosaminyl deacetylase
MRGTPENDLPEAFWQADLEQAAAKLAAILAEEQVDVFTIYDENGHYGHPDHIQVYRVGARAAELAGAPRVYMTTMNRDYVRQGLEAMAEAGGDVPTDLDEEFLNTFGVPAERITTTVDVRDWTDRKRAAMAAHASQISETSFFLSMEPARFKEAFGYEWFIRCDAEPGLREADLFDGLD